MSLPEQMEPEDIQSSFSKFIELATGQGGFWSAMALVGMPLGSNAKALGWDTWWWISRGPGSCA